jgi:hypothetical protein
MTASPYMASRFERWLRRSPKGARIVYYAGDLSRDRGDPSAPKTQSDMQKAVSDLGDAVWRAHEKTQVNLVRARVSAGVFSYVAIKR